MRSDLRSLRERIRQVEAGGHRDTSLRRAYNRPNATISWTLVSAEDAPLHALVPTIVSLRRIEAGEFVMLDYGVRYSMDNGHHRA